MGNRVTELLRAKRRQVRHLALVLVLALLVAAAVGGIFHLPAVAKTYQKTVLACTAVPPTGPGYAGFFVHVHNDDCFDENGNLVCPLPEIKPHVHDESCYTTTAVLVCTLPESDGHQHTEDCYTLVKGDLICEESTEPVYNADGAIIAEGHVHTDECFEWNKELSCGMEEGDGAHHHNDSCFEYVTTLTCDKPEIILHVHTDECYTVDEDENVYLTCGLPEVTEHVHGPECFTTIELDDGEPEFVVMTEEAQPAEGGSQELEADGDGNTEEKTETGTETKETEEENKETVEETKEPGTETEETVPVVPMPAQSWERTAGGMKVTVEAPEGAFPENTKIAVTPVNGSSLKDAVSDAVNGEVLEVQAVDITFFNAEGREIEPAVAIRVTMIPAETQNAEEKANVVHIDLEQQTAEVIAQAEGTESDNSEVVFDAEAFTIYAIVYTVHFEYEVDGETFTSASMPGAEYTSLAEVIRGLGIVSEEEVETFVSKISTVASTNEDVAVVENTDAGLCVRVLRDGDAQIVITMQDGATFRVDVVADGETATGNETATVSTVGDLYLPAEAKLEAKALDEVQGESAIAAVQAAEETVSSLAAAETVYQVFDISLENVEADQYDGFQVEVKLPENVVGRDFRLFHIHDGETTEIELNTLSRPADDTGLEVVSGFTFETKDFSEFVLKYTVDFTYEGRTWSFPGQGSYRLADVLAVLGIEGSIDDASLTLIMGEDHAGALYLTQVDGEYYINSDIAFADTYELRVRVGEKIYIITVTDTQVTTNLSKLLKNAVIIGATQEPITGEYHVEAGVEYDIILTFGEDASFQFDDEGTLTYQMPAGITILSEQTGSAVINVVYKGRTYSIDYDYVLNTNGLLTIHFDQEDPDFPKIKGSTDVSFRFTYEGLFDGSETNIEFNNVLERDLIFDEPEPAQAYVSKSGSFDEKTGTYTYTIKVKSSGNTTNVNVKDVISGNALLFNDDVQVSVDSNRYTINDLSDGEKGFDYTFASMQDGEEITITYTASLNPDNIPENGKVTADMTRNTVTVTPDDGPPHNSSYSHEINLKKPDKSTGIESGTTTDGKKLYKWTIEYNTLALANAGGDMVSDSIGESSRQYMKYYGDVSVKVYNHSGSLVATRSFTPGTDYTWTYIVPDTDNNPYRYVFEYETEVDQAAIDLTGLSVKLNNDSEGPGGKDSEGITIVPKESTSITKEVVSSDEREITWISHIHVPESGLSKAVVTDTLPYIWSGNLGLSGNYMLYDEYVDGSLEINGLLEGEESYSVAHNIDPLDSHDKIVITFYKDIDKTTEGLNGGTPGGRDITVKLTTKVNQDWLKAGYNYPTSYQSFHTNNININGGEDVQAQVKYLEPGIKKTGIKTGDKQYKYTIYVTHVDSSPIIINDIFDRSVLEVDTSLDGQDWNKQSMYISGGDYPGHVYVSETSAKVDYSDTTDGIQITANNVPLQDNGQYYPTYMITYFLKLKEGVDLEQLAIANGGEYDLTNKALWGDYESEFSFKTTYDFLNKELINETDLGGTSRDAQYRITFNSAKATLNGGAPMEMTDVMSANLSVDYSSIQIVSDPEGQAVPYSLSGGKDEQGISDGTTVATYTVPDSTKVVITYNASVRGNGTQVVVNKVSVHGKEKTIETTKSYGGGSEGEGTSASFKIVKVDGYDANIKLEGVQFKIYPNDPTIDFGKDDSGNVRKELLLTTDENGEIILDGEEYDFYYNKLYYVQEVAPLEDYSAISFPYQVTLTNDMALVDYGHYVYYYPDSMQIKNWPLEGLVVEKQVESSNNNDKERYYNFKVTVLKEDGETTNTDYNVSNSDYTFVNGVCEFELKDKEQMMFWGFTKGTKYKVEEIDSKGLTVSYTYSTYDEDGNVTGTTTVLGGGPHSGTLTQESEVITFTNSKTEQKGALKLTKTVTVNGAEIPDSATAEQKKAADGDYTFTITGPGTQGTFSKTVVIKVENGVATKYKIDNATTYTDLLGDKFVVISDLTPGVYTITETTPTNGTVISKINNQTTTSYSTTVTVVAGDTAAAQAFATFTNNINLGSLEITKSIQRNGTADATATGTFYYAVYNEQYNPDADPAQTPVKTGSITITTGGTNTATESDLPYGTYYVYELDGENGTPIVSGDNGVRKVISDTIYTVTGSGTSATISSSTSPGSVALTNNVETTDVSVEKQWKPAVPENTTITLGLYSGKTAAAATTQVNTIELDGTPDSTAANINGTDTKAGTKQETSAWKAEFKNLPKYANDATNGIYEIAYVVKEESVPDGYTVTYSGTNAGTDYVITGGTITNTKKPGDLELTKKVAGGGDTTKEFEFTIELTAPSGEILAESYKYTKTGTEGEQTLTLNRTNGDTKATVSITLIANQTYTIKGLPAGTTYTITEVDYSGQGYSASPTVGSLSGTITGGTTAKESVEVTNTLSAGNLTVEKKLEGNATGATKNFEFKVTFEKSGLNGNYGSYTISTTATQTASTDDEGAGQENSGDGNGNGTASTEATATAITFTNGEAVVTFNLKGGQKAEFTGLPTGTTFTVEETSKDADGYETTVSSTGGTVDAANKTVTGTITTSAAITAKYTNTKNKTDIEATKVWKNGDTPIAWPEDVESVEFTLYKTVNNQTTAVVADDLKNYWEDTSTFTNPITVSSNTEGKKASWDNLPTRMLVTTTETVDGQEVTTSAWYGVTYSVKETKINYTAASLKPAKTVDVAADETKIITNTETTLIHVTKEWQNKDGTVLTGNQIPENAQVTFTLLANGTAVTKTVDGAAVPRTVILDGTDETNGGTSTPTSEDYEGAEWTAYFTNLPVYDTDGKVITYTVQETGTWTGYVVVTTGDGITYPAIDGGTIINKESSLALDILKKDTAGTVITTGATFRIVQINDTLQADEKPDTVQTDQTKDDGTLTFGGLTVGYYKITETVPPPGYILPNDATFYVEVTETEIKLLTKESGKTPSDWDATQTSGGIVKTFAHNQITGNEQATVENTSGTALPQTGGIGTTLFTALGGLLTVTAGAVLTLTSRRGKRKTAEG